MCQFYNTRISKTRTVQTALPVGLLKLPDCNPFSMLLFVVQNLHILLNYQFVILPDHFLNPVVHIYLTAWFSLFVLTRPERWMFLCRFHPVEQDDNRALPCESLSSSSTLQTQDSSSWASKWCIYTNKEVSWYYHDIFGDGTIVTAWYF